MSYSILLFDKMIELNERVKLSVKRRDALKTIPLKRNGFHRQMLHSFFYEIDEMKSMYYHMYIDNLY